MTRECREVRCFDVVEVRKKLDGGRRGEDLFAETSIEWSAGGCLD